MGGSAARRKRQSLIKQIQRSPRQNSRGLFHDKIKAYATRITAAFIANMHARYSVWLNSTNSATSHRQKRCNVQLIAHCIRVDDNSTPILQCSYHEIEREVRSRDKNIEVGNQRIVWVNPNNPYEYILEGEKSSVVTVYTIIGAFALVGSMTIITNILYIAAMTAN